MNPDEFVNFYICKLVLLMHFALIMMIQRIAQGLDEWNSLQRSIQEESEKTWKLVSGVAAFLTCCSVTARRFERRKGERICLRIDLFFGEDFINFQCSFESFPSDSVD